MEERFDATIRGTAPLLMHRFSNEKDSTTPKKSGSQYNDREYAENALYKNEKGEIVQPALHIESAMVDAATNYRIPGQSRKTYKQPFRGGVFIEPNLIPHKIPKWQLDLQSVVIQRSRIMRARPRFDEWELDFTILNIDERITSSIIRSILEDAGKFIGIGNYRPRYGRFKVIKFELNKKTTRDKS
jgi:hypothetical protein